MRLQLCFSVYYPSLFLLFPPPRHTDGIGFQHESLGGCIYKKQMEVHGNKPITEATAQGIASMLCAHGPEVEWRICTIWEAAYGLLPLSSSAVDLPEIIVATPLQPPALSWNLYLPLLKVSDYLPCGSPSEACLMRIFVATVEAILQRTFPLHSSREQTRRSRYNVGTGSTSKNLAVAELRTMINSLFLESCASVELTSRLLFVVLTLCVSHEALPNGSKRPVGGDLRPPSEGLGGPTIVNGSQRSSGTRTRKKQGPVATFDSYVFAAVCALACELQLFSLTSKCGKYSESKEILHVSEASKVNGALVGLPNGIGSAVCHTRRILGILEALFSLKPSSVGTSWSCSSNEIVAAAMVAAHVSELFRKSKACMHALSILLRCKWDNEIHTRASSLYHLIDIHGKDIASIVDNAEPLKAHLVQEPLWKYAAPKCINSRKRLNSSSSNNFGTQDPPTRQCEGGDNTVLANSVNSLERGKTLLLTDIVENKLGKEISYFPVDTSELANFLSLDRHIGFNCNVQALLRSVEAEKHELCFSVVSLLWHKLIAFPETEMIAESTSAQQGWRQVVDALCNVVLASPTKASTAVVLQAERYLQPWIVRDDDQSQKMWKINRRIVKLMVELMRNHDCPEALMILASTSDLLLRATDGMLVDGEACTLPQLELLEATAKAVHLVLNWGDFGSAVADGLSNLLKCRLPATVRCLSHPSAHVRALSSSVLRDILKVGSANSNIDQEDVKNAQGRSFNYVSTGIINWHADIENCLT